MNPPPVNLQYVVLHHGGIDHPHYDLMFEITPGGELSTCRLNNWPPKQGDAIEKIGDHRRAYLTYEGPVSNNRGVVKRVEAGSCRVEGGKLVLKSASGATRIVTLPH